MIYLTLINSDEEISKFEKIYIKYKQIMFYVANKILRDEFLAEDAVHIAFLKIIDNLSKVNSINCPKTKSFIVIIVERVAIDLYRKRKKQNIIFIEDSPYIYEPSYIDVPYSDSNSDICLAINKLPDNYRHVILLKYSHGFNDIEISKILDISQANVRKRIQRAKQKLKEMLTEMEAM